MSFCVNGTEHIIARIGYTSYTALGGILTINGAARNVNAFIRRTDVAL